MANLRSEASSHRSHRSTHSANIPTVDVYVANASKPASSNSSSSSSKQSEYSYDPYEDDYHYAVQDDKERQELLEQSRRFSSSTFRKSSSKPGLTSVQQDRIHQANPAKIRPKFDKGNWDGMNSTFRTFKAILEGHLLQVGAGYLTNPTFMTIYKDLGTDCFKSDVFWKLFKIPYAQALYDRQYLYGILLSATVNVKHKKSSSMKNPRMASLHGMSLNKILTMMVALNCG